MQNEWRDKEFKIKHHKYPSRNVKEDSGDMKKKLTVTMRNQVDILHMKNIKFEIKIL